MCDNLVRKDPFVSAGLLPAPQLIKEELETIKLHMQQGEVDARALRVYSRVVGGWFRSSQYRWKRMAVIQYAKEGFSTC